MDFGWFFVVGEFLLKDLVDFCNRNWIWWGPGSSSKNSGFQVFMLQKLGDPQVDVVSKGWISCFWDGFLTNFSWSRVFERSAVWIILLLNITGCFLHQNAQTKDDPPARKRSRAQKKSGSIHRDDIHNSPNWIWTLQDSNFQSSICWPTNTALPFFLDQKKWLKMTRQSFTTIDDLGRCLQILTQSHGQKHQAHAEDFTTQCKSLRNGKIRGINGP